MIRHKLSRKYKEPTNAKKEQQHKTLTHIDI